MINQGEPLTVTISAAGINGILLVEFSSVKRKEEMWVIGVSKKMLSKVKYGEIPEGCKQLFPPEGKNPRKPEADEEVRVRVLFQFDGGVPPVPCTGDRKIVFKAPT